MTGVPLKLRRDTKAKLLTVVPLLAEAAVDTTDWRIRLGDGLTLGGIPMARLDELPTPQVGFLNRIRNGEFRFDQRRAGGSVTVSTTSVVTLDGWIASAVGGGAFSIQRQAVTDLVGLAEPFANSVKIITTTADASLAATDNYTFSQRLLGVDVADLAWGTSSARPVTFVVCAKSSATGSLNWSVRNYAGTRSYAFQTTVTAAGAWQRFVVTIPGDTGGLWVSDLNPSLILSLDLGSGVTYQTATQNSWGPGLYLRADSGLAPISTLSASVEITGVELKPGNIVSGFPRLAYTDELARLETYFQKSYDLATLAGTATTYPGQEIVFTPAVGPADWAKVPLRRRMRTTPTITLYSPVNVAAGVVYSNGTSTDIVATVPYSGETGFNVRWTSSGAAVGHRFHWTADAEVI